MSRLTDSDTQPTVSVLFKDLAETIHAKAQVAETKLVNEQKQGTEQLLKPNRLRAELCASDFVSLLTEDHRAQGVWRHVVGSVATSAHWWGQLMLFDKTCVKFSSRWQYQCPAVDRDGDTADLFSLAKQGHSASQLFFKQVGNMHGASERITADKSGSKTAVIVGVQANCGPLIETRQSKYLNPSRQDHGAAKRIMQPILSFKKLLCARMLIAGNEVMHMIRKDQCRHSKDQSSPTANLCYSLAF